jgi:hypothetical protein
MKYTKIEASELAFAHKLNAFLRMLLLKFTEQKKTTWFQTENRTIPTERLPLVDEVSANFSG